MLPISKILRATIQGVALSLALSPAPSGAATSPSPAAAPTAAGQPVFSAEAVFDLSWVSDPQISPDGTQIAYVRQSMDIRTDQVRGVLWLSKVDGRRAEPLTEGASDAASQRWSPDGSRIAYISHDTDGSAQIFVRYLPGGSTARVTTLTESPSNLTWSPDGRQLAFLMPVAAEHKPLKVQLPEPPKGAKWADPPKIIDRMVYRADGAGYLPNTYRQLFIVSADGGAARALTHGDFNHSGPPSFTPDGKQILISVNRRDDADYEPMDSEIYAVDVGIGSLHALTNRRGPDIQPVVSPDGKQIAYLGFDDRYQGYQPIQLYVMDRDGRHSRALTADLDRDAEGPIWSADSRELFIQYDDHGSTRIARVDMSGRRSVMANDLGGTDVTRPYAGGSFSVARNGRFAYTRASPSAPAALATGTSLRDIKTLTDLNANGLSAHALGAVEELGFASSTDQRAIQGWLVKPPGFDPAKKYPLILEIHGGPFSNYGPRFAAEIQLYAAGGYVVLYLNPRGSTSYGQEFGDLIHHDYPNKDYDDLMSGVDTVIKRGFIDPQRLFVTGGSGGGVLTAWIVGHTERFRAAAVVKPVINWTSFVLTADESNFFYRYWFEGPPWEHMESYWKRSPLAYVGAVKTPTLVMTGEVDMRTPSSEAEQFYQALRLRKIPTALVRVPGASHDISARPSLLVAKTAYILAWFKSFDTEAAR